MVGARPGGPVAYGEDSGFYFKCDREPLESQSWSLTSSAIMSKGDCFSASTHTCHVKTYIWPRVVKSSEFSGKTRNLAIVNVKLPIFKIFDNILKALKAHIQARFSQDLSSHRL